ncbi:MAG: beta-ketoacyl synthase N-terminal-like domain-containing protein [Bacteroidota bacterium]
MAAIEVSGCGAITPIGLGINAFKDALKNGNGNFSIQEFTHGDALFQFPAALIEPFDLKQKIAELELPEDVSKKARRYRNISLGTSYAIYCALEAWKNADLFNTAIDSERIAIIAGGSNTQLQDSLDIHQKYNEKMKFMNPNHAMNLFDTDVNGVLSELLNIRGEGYSVGGASASSNVALVHAQRLLSAGLYDAILVVAPMINLSLFEYQSFSNLGAMSLLSDELSPSELCRPFDNGHRGFVYGQNTGCILLETAESAAKRSRQNKIAIVGGGNSLDANRNPNPSVEGESRAITNALQSADLEPGLVDYINLHGTASALGDETELNAVKMSGLKPQYANSTKSLIGHGLTAAGLTEAIATIIQMEEGFIHQSNNMTDPMASELNFPTEGAVQADISYALSNGFGFGGINTSILLENLSQTKK